MELTFHLNDGNADRSRMLADSIISSGTVIYIVTSALSAMPCVERLRNPVAYVDAKQLSCDAVIYELQLSEIGESQKNDGSHSKTVRSPRRRGHPRL